MASKSFRAETILEIGAGNLNHIKFEKGYKIYDVVEPKKYLISAAKIQSKESLEININIYLKYQMNYLYKKILAIQVLEHIDELNEFLIEVSKHLEQDGRFIIEIPAEGEFFMVAGLETNNWDRILA